MQYVATCLFGLEKFLGEEIEALGLKKLETIDGRVTFEGDPIDCARANIGLRTAERVLIKIGSFPATDFTMLFDGTKSLPWEQFIGAEDQFPVKGHSIRSGLTSVPDCQSIIKKAVVSRLQESYAYEHFPETGVKYQIEFFLFRDVVTLMIDTSGDPLHKRGYRPVSGGAPLRETLAAAMAMNARLSDEILLWDPFCGSGTILIEAVMLMNRIAPGLDRSFAGEELACFPPELWEQARNEAEENIRYDSSFEAWGSDLDEEVLKIAKENAERAGVADQIKFFRADARTIRKPEDRKGTVITNPPYGERLLTVEEAEALYRDIGRNFRFFAPWQIYVLTMSETFERSYGSRADKVRKLYNGMIPCNLYQYYVPQHAREERAQSGRASGGKKGGTYHPFERKQDRPHGDRPRGDQSRGDKPYGDRPHGDRPRGDKLYGDRPHGDRPHGDKPYGDRPHGDRPHGDKPYGDRPHGDRPHGDRPRGDKPYGDRPHGDRSHGDRSHGDQAQGERKTFAPRTPRGDRSSFEAARKKRTDVWRDRPEREIPTRRMNPQKKNPDDEA